MLKRVLPGAFAVNLGFLLLHEMDAVFWQEWRLFGITDDVLGRELFLVVHLPLFVFLLFGFLKLEERFGKVVSLALSSFLIVHFFLHAGPLGQGRFHGAFSTGIIVANLLSSVVQWMTTVALLVRQWPGTPRRDGDSHGCLGGDRAFGE